MKKNRIMRTGIIMLALTLMTSCFVGGTFAKYVTNAEGSDSARVAKWGVEATVTGSAFSDKYNVAEKGDREFDMSVSSDVKVLAPGTSGEFTGVAISGTPETAVGVTKKADVELTGWLVDGAFYCPVVITVNGSAINGLNYSSADEFEAAVKSAVEAFNGEYAPGTDLSAVDGLDGAYSWEWAFDGTTGSVSSQSDEKDTALGNLEAAGTANTIKLSAAVSVTQID